jgi:hypothetical protein
VLASAWLGAGWCCARGGAHGMASACNRRAGPASFPCRHAKAKAAVL